MSMPEREQRRLQATISRIIDGERVSFAGQRLSKGNVFCAALLQVQGKQPLGKEQRMADAAAAPVRNYSVSKVDQQVLPYLHGGRNCRRAQLKWK